LNWETPAYHPAHNAIPLDYGYNRLGPVITGDYETVRANLTRSHRGRLLKLNIGLCQRSLIYVELAVAQSNGFSRQTDNAFDYQSAAGPDRYDLPAPGLPEEIDELVDPHDLPGP